MATLLPQGKLRNDIASVLRRAERGERFTVTVAGRPVAELGPLSGAREAGTLADLASIIDETQVDRRWTEELLAGREHDEAVTVDPWTT